MKERRPIFYDVERVRWRRTRLVLEISGALLTLLLAYFFVTIAVTVDLPAGFLPDTKPGYHPFKLKKNSKPIREGRHRRVASIGTVPTSYEPVRAAFFVSWDPNSLASLKKHYREIDLLIPEQLHAVSPDGALTVVDYERGQARVKASPTEAIAILKDDKLHRWMRSLNPPVELPIMGQLNNYDGTTWRIKEMAEMLANPTARQKLVRDLVEFAVHAHEAGIVVDFEEVPDSSQPYFRQFAAELGPALHSVGLKFMIAPTLPPISKSAERIEQRLHPHTAFMTGFVRVLANPNVLLFWITLSATFVAHEWMDTTWQSKVSCVGGVAVGALAWFVMLSFGASRGHGRCSDNTLLKLSRVSGGLLVLMALYLGTRLVMLLAHRR